MSREGEGDNSGAEKRPVDWMLVISQLLESPGAAEAWRVCQSALLEHPTSPELLISAAMALMKLDRAVEAEQYVARAAALCPQSAVIWDNWGIALRNQNRIGESLACFEKAIKLDRAWARPHYDRAFSLLLAGDFEKGWPEYEYRWGAHGLERPGDNEPAMRDRVWKGQEVKGTRLLLYAEQGLGDTIQFVRYVAPLQTGGAEVVLEVQPALRGLMQCLRPECEVGMGDGLKPFDLHCPLMTLPLIFGTRLETVPPPAVFEVPSEVQVKWKQKLPAGDRLKVGLVWAGHPENPRDEFRSTHFQTFAPLLEDERLREKVQFFSLQVGARTIESELIYDLRPELTSATETAGALLQVDLVIAVDTFVAHLAASLGIRVWVLLSFSPDWRWLLEREDSPWYAPMRLFRQRAAGDWAGVAARVREELTKVVQA